MLFRLEHRREPVEARIGDVRDADVRLALVGGRRFRVAGEEREERRLPGELETEDAEFHGGILPRSPSGCGRSGRRARFRVPRGLSGPPRDGRRVRLAVQDTALSRRRSRVQIPYAVPAPRRFVRRRSLERPFSLRIQRAPHLGRIRRSRPMLDPRVRQRKALFLAGGVDAIEPAPISLRLRQGEARRVKADGDGVVELAMRDREARLAPRQGRPSGRAACRGGTLLRTSQRTPAPWTTDGRARRSTGTVNVKSSDRAETDGRRLAATAAAIREVRLFDTILIVTLLTLPPAAWSRSSSRRRDSRHGRAGRHTRRRPRQGEGRSRDDDAEAGQDEPVRQPRESRHVHRLDHPLVRGVSRARAGPSSASRTF